MFIKREDTQGIYENFKNVRRCGIGKARISVFLNQTN